MNEAMQARWLRGLTTVLDALGLPGLLSTACFAFWDGSPLVGVYLFGMLIAFLGAEAQEME